MNAHLGKRSSFTHRMPSGQRLIGFRQGDSRVGDAKVLGQVFTPRSANSTDSFAIPCLILNHRAIKRVKLAQIYDGFRETNR